MLYEVITLRDRNMRPETRSLWRAKLKAFAIHLGISAVLFGIVIAVLIRLWRNNFV